jgi:hypothetical protein
MPVNAWNIPHQFIATAFGPTCIILIHENEHRVKGLLGVWAWQRMIGILLPFIVWTTGRGGFLGRMKLFIIFKHVTLLVD